MHAQGSFKLLQIFIEKQVKLNCKCSKFSCIEMDINYREVGHYHRIAGSKYISGLHLTDLLLYVFWKRRICRLWNGERKR